MILRGISRFGTLESRFYLFFTVIFFATILGMQIVSFRFTVSAVSDASIETKKILLGQLVDGIDAYIAGMERISGVVASDSEVGNYLRGSSAEGDGYAQRIQQRLSDYIRVREDISSILILRNDGKAVGSDPKAKLSPWSDYRHSPWYTETLAAYGKTVVSGSYVQNLYAGKYSWVVSLSRELFDENLHSLGVLLVDLKFNRIRELCESLIVGTNGYTFVIDDQGRYVFHPAQQLVYSGIKSEPIMGLIPGPRGNSYSVFEDGDRHYMIARSLYTGWLVASVSYGTDAVSGWGYVRFTYAVIGVVVFLVLGAITNFISKGITRPLYQLQSVMRSVETGEFREAGDLKASDEIRELAKEYDLMVGRIRALIAANIKEQEQKRMSDLKALQAQINPHFLYNTLDSIVWMAEMNRSAEVVEMTSALARLFRISISRGLERIPLRDEADHVRSYLTIQKMRYGDRFSYTIDIPDSLLEHTVLKIMLQPLVENAIYHGIRSLTYTGLIEIGAHVENDHLLVWVQDNGTGMDVVELNRLLESLDAREETPVGMTRQGLGVRNVHERIKLYFGKEYGLQVSSRPGQGTRITCFLPLVLEEPA